MQRAHLQEHTLTVTTQERWADLAGTLDDCFPSLQAASLSHAFQQKRSQPVLLTSVRRHAPFSSILFLSDSFWFSNFMAVNLLVN